MTELKRPTRRPAKSFEEYVSEKTGTPEKRAAFDAAREKVRSTAALLEALDAWRDDQKISKAELGRRAQMHAAAISRLFTDENSNPTWETFVELLAALDLHADITLRPRSHDGIKEKHVLDVKTEYAVAS